jgi:hypothetical protein
MRRPGITVLCLGVLAALAPVTLACGSGSTLVVQTQHQTQRLQVALPKGAPQQPVGAQAITPTQPGRSPAFTSDDVKAYLLKSGVPGAVVDDPKAITILSIDFIASKEASARLNGEALGLPDGYLVCFVRLQGQFTFSGPYNPQSSEKPGPATFTTMTEIFDAQTGNLLGYGGP